MANITISSSTVGTPYNSTAWVPFVVYWPGVSEPGRRVNYPVGLIDLVPTVVDLMRWEVEAAPFHGRSLLPVLVGERSRVDDYVIVEAGEGGLQKHQFLRSIEDARWKLIHVPSEGYQRRMQGSPFELYDMRADPMETASLVTAHPELVDRLSSVLEGRLEEGRAFSDNPPHPPDYSTEELENLRSLGYIR